MTLKLGLTPPRHCLEILRTFPRGRVRSRSDSSTASSSSLFSSSLSHGFSTARIRLPTTATTRSIRLNSSAIAIASARTSGRTIRTGTLENSVKLPADQSSSSSSHTRTRTRTHTQIRTLTQVAYKPVDPENEGATGKTEECRQTVPSTRRHGAEYGPTSAQSTISNTNPSTSTATDKDLPIDRHADRSSTLTSTSPSSSRRPFKISFQPPTPEQVQNILHALDPPSKVNKQTKRRREMRQERRERWEMSSRSGSQVESDEVRTLEGGRGGGSFVSFNRRNDERNGEEEGEGIQGRPDKEEVYLDTATHPELDENLEPVFSTAAAPPSSRPLNLHLRPRPRPRTNHASHSRSCQPSPRSLAIPHPTRTLPFRTVLDSDVHSLEKSFNTLRSQSTYDLTLREDQNAVRAYVNHLLWLSAKVPNMRMYNRISHVLKDMGDLKPDSFTFLTRVVLLDRLDQVDQIPVVWRAHAEQVQAQEQAQGQRTTDKDKNGRRGNFRPRKKVEKGMTVMVNAVLWALAKRGRWDIVQPMYTKLLLNLKRSQGDHSGRRGDDVNDAEVSPEIEELDANLSKFPSTPPNYSSTLNPYSFPLSTSAIPDQITYSLLIQSLAFHGNFGSAVSVLQDLIADPRGYTPDPSVFVALFRGFARFGRVPEVDEEGEGEGEGENEEESGRLAGVRDGEGAREDFWLRTIRTAHERADGDTLRPGDNSRRRRSRLFPDPIYPEPLTLDGRDDTADSLREQETDRQHGDRDRGSTTFQRLTDIWARRVSDWQQQTSNPPPTTMKNANFESQWTLSALNQLFMAFLSIQPQPRPQAQPQQTQDRNQASDTANAELPESSGNRAPTPRAIHMILTAFARTTGEDKEALRNVWDDLENKFGPDNKEGWRGWKEDQRLQTLKRRLGC